MDIVTLSSKGQIVIPAEVRKELGLAKGNKIVVERKEDTIILRPIPNLSQLKGVDDIERASEKLKQKRKAWDEEFGDRL